MNWSDDYLFMLIDKLPLYNMCKFRLTCKDFNKYITENEEVIFKKYVFTDYDIRKKNDSFTWKQLYKFCHDFKFSGTCKVSNIFKNHE